MRNSAPVLVAQPFLAVRRKPPPIPKESSLIATVPLESCPKDFHQRKTSTGRNACATKARQSQTVPLESSPHDLPAKRTRTGKNACATLEPTSHDLLPPQPAEADSEESPGRIFRQLDATLDSARSGPLWLADPEFAAYAEYPILRGAELGRYVLHAYVVMPNHVHVLLDAHLPLAKISGVIKGVAARDINGSLGRSGKPLWQDESFDHWVRNSAEFERIRYYIEWNPVHASLVARPEDWKWSSAGNVMSGPAATIH